MRVLIHLLSFLAAPAPHAEFRAISFDEPSVEVFLLDPPASRQGKPGQRTEARGLPLHSHALTHAVRVRCPENRLTFHRRTRDADGRETYRPLASAPVPAEGGTFLAILHGTAGNHGLSLVPDTGPEGAGGTLRFLNLCPAPVAMSFPGLREVIAPAKQVLLRPLVKAEDYGQGQFFLPDGEEWRPAGGLRWLQLEDIRTLWFILPAPGQPGIVTLRGIEERIPPPVKGSGGAKGTRPASASSGPLRNR